MFETKKTFLNIMGPPKELRRHLVLERVVPSSPVNECIVFLEPSSGRRILRSMQFSTGLMSTEEDNVLPPI
ncbi:hypothetical protein C5167_046944 [Papaver somniferum]|uniref:Uncharacterized protein n=1 Tax=Papaver somniferum TaxID=3469 RepID=A0A4Y7LGS3_PAPSO|nr:hypothetical protein C5167_046944 [Papaver somniferum]